MSSNVSECSATDTLTLEDMPILRTGVSEYKDVDRAIINLS